MVKRSIPEVVARLRTRRQQRGEPLVEYAQKIREIAAINPVGEEWLVKAFLDGQPRGLAATTPGLVPGMPTLATSGVQLAGGDVLGSIGIGYDSLVFGPTLRQGPVNNAKQAQQGAHVLRSDGRALVAAQLRLVWNDPTVVDTGNHLRSFVTIGQYVLDGAGTTDAAIRGTGQPNIKTGIVYR
ncbi:hypothetical protein ON010_g3397 [Phytophthora cinnamomi]|nr:hypothetical protein ON010_g3397 [Phytophthora cinnamomi]